MDKSNNNNAKPSAPLVENEDYYFDPDGLMVFTAAYLLKRGFCCHKGCRHCPYRDSKNDATKN